MPSCTSQFSNRQAVGPVFDLQLAVDAGVESALRKSNVQVPTPLTAKALIDTGASATVIQQGMASQLGLNPVGITHIHTPSSTNVRCFEYSVRLLISSSVTVEATVIEAPLQGQNIQCLIGRDVLAHGVLVYIGYSNLFSLSF